ncbi:MAG: DNA primase, partial [Candidatus Cloacimonadota bacterium]|nr:DNA primase [Candidatus Cloacimonadota bacterium]
MKKVMFIITLILASSIFAFEPHFMKDPEISPSGEWVCFSYFSDLWRVPFNGGIAERLTSVEGNDWNAQYSPNGKKIVFNTNRNGWNEIFIMPAEGGKAELVSSEPFIILDWFPDSKNLLVSGNEPGFKNVFYKLNLNGNYEQITLWGAAYAKLNNKGDRIVFNKRGIPYRETYTGSFNGDIWFYDIKNDNFQRLTNTAHSEMYPVFSSTTNNIYYSETVDKSFQIFKTIDFTKTQQVTTAKELGNWSARKLEIAKNNDRIVFELFDEIWKYDPQKNSVKKLEIQINEDAIAPNLVREDVANKVNAFAVSSDGDFIVFSYKYDLFAVPAQDGEVKQLTKDQAGVEDIIIVDKNIYFTSFDGGEKKLYRTNLEQPFEKEMIKWTKDILIDQVVLSNDHLIVYYSNYLRSGMLAIADSNGKLLTKIEDIFIDNGMESASVSPDGKYLSYLELKPGIWTRHLHIKNLKDDSDKVVYSSESYMSDFFWGKDGQSAFITKNSDIFRIDLKPKDDFYNEEDQWQKILSETKEEKKEKTEG